MFFNNQFDGGLLSDDDYFNLNKNAGLQTALGLLAASGPSTTPTNFAQVLSKGLEQGEDARKTGLANALQRQQLLKQRQTETQRKQVFGSLAGNDAQEALAAGGGPTPQNAQRMGGMQAERFNKALNNALMMGDRELVGELLKWKETMMPKATYEKIGEGEQLINPATGQVVAQVAPKKPSAVQEYEYAKAGGYNGSFQDFQIQQKRAGASNTNVNINGDNAFAKKGAELVATQFNDISVQGKTAQRNLVQINQLDSLLDKTGGGIVPQIKMVAGNLGIPVEGLSDIQAATAIINQLVPAQRPAGSGTMSDQDVELFKKSVPRLINQPGGNKKIIQTIRGINEYDRQMGQIASDALTGKINRAEADQKMQQIPNPLQGFQVGSSAPKVPANPDALLKKYGVK